MDLGVEGGGAPLLTSERMAAARRRIGMNGATVMAAAIALVACAGIGAYLGYSRAAFTPGGSVDTDAYNVTPVDAKKAASIDAAAPPPVDEAYIRKIAHDEAEAVLHPPKKVVASATADDTDDSSDDSNANPPTPPSGPALSQPPVIAAPKAPPPPPTGLY